MSISLKNKFNKGNNKGNVLVFFCCYDKIPLIYDLKTQQCILLQFWWSKMSQQGCIPSGGPRGEFASLPMLASTSCLHFSAHDPNLHLENQQCSIYHYRSVLLPFIFTSPFLSDPLVSLL